VGQFEDNEPKSELADSTDHSHSHRGFSPVTHNAPPKNDNRFNGFENRRRIDEGKPLKRFPDFSSGCYQRGKATV